MPYGQILWLPGDWEARRTAICWLWAWHGRYGRDLQDEARTLWGSTRPAPQTARCTQNPGNLTSNDLLLITDAGQTERMGSPESLLKIPPEGWSETDPAKAALGRVVHSMLVPPITLDIVALEEETPFDTLWRALLASTDHHTTLGQPWLNLRRRRSMDDLLVEPKVSLNPNRPPTWTDITGPRGHSAADLALATGRSFVIVVTSADRDVAEENKRLQKLRRRLGARAVYVMSLREGAAKTDPAAPDASPPWGSELDEVLSWLAARLGKLGDVRLEDRPWIAWADAPEITKSRPLPAAIRDLLRTSNCAPFSWTDAPDPNRPGLLLVPNDPEATRHGAVGAALIDARRAGTPILVVDMGDSPPGQTSLLPTHAPVLRALGASPRDVVQRALQVWMRALVVRLEYNRMAQHRPSAHRITILPRSPDPTDLVTGASRGRPPELLLHPDPPLVPLEAQCLHRLAPATEVETPTTLLTTRTPPGQGLNLPALRVAISVSETQEPPGAAGPTEIAMLTALHRLTTVLLASGVDILYAGALQSAAPAGAAVQFTHTLAALIQSSSVVYAGRRRALHVHKAASANTEHPGVRICLVGSPGWSPRRAGSDEVASLRKLHQDAEAEASNCNSEAVNPARLVQNAFSYSLEREAQTQDADARILVGGPRAPRCQQASDARFLPGILEEAWRSIKTAGQPLYVVGGFGGSAAEVAQLLRVEKLEPPKWTKDPIHTDLRTRAGDIDHDGLIPTWSRVASDLQRKGAHLGWNNPICADPEAADRLNLEFNGLTREENLRLLDSIDPLEICSLILRGLQTWSMAQTTDKICVLTNGPLSGARSKVWVVGVDAVEGPSAPEVPLPFRKDPQTWSQPVDHIRRHIDGIGMVDLVLFHKGAASDDVAFWLKETIRHHTWSSAAILSGDLLHLLGKPRHLDTLSCALDSIARLEVHLPWGEAAGPGLRKWEDAAHEAGRHPTAPRRSGKARPAAPSDLLYVSKNERGPASLVWSLGASAGARRTTFDANHHERLADGVLDSARADKISRSLDPLVDPVRSELLASEAPLICTHEEGLVPLDIELAPTGRADAPYLSLYRPIIHIQEAGSPLRPVKRRSSEARMLMIGLEEAPLVGEYIKKQHQELADLLKPLAPRLCITRKTSLNAADMTSLLAESWDIIHITTHGKDGCELQTADGVWWTPPERLPDGTASPRLVFVNACRSAHTSAAASWNIMKWFSCFGAEALIGPRNAIHISDARNAALLIYRALYDGYTLPQAMLRMRKQMYQSDQVGASCTYVQYGGARLRLSDII